MSDAVGRPVTLRYYRRREARGARVSVCGFPVIVDSWMPDVAAGATPVAFGNWQEASTLVNRRATTMTPDPYGAGFCALFRFEARIGGAVTCANAAHLLRIR